MKTWSFILVIRAVKTIEEADVCILMLDATVGIESQDLTILSLITRKNKGLVILVNKWDLVENKETNTARDFENELKERIAPLQMCPLLPFLCLKNAHFKAVEIAMVVLENRSRKIKTSELNDVMLLSIERYPPPSHRGKFIKPNLLRSCHFLPCLCIFAITQNTFCPSYRNYLENQLQCISSLQEYQ